MQSLWIAPILGAPEVSVPGKIRDTSCARLHADPTVGEIAYFSRVSLQEEHLPLVVSILAEPGRRCHHFRQWCG